MDSVLRFSRFAILTKLFCRSIFTFKVLFLLTFLIASLNSWAQKPQLPDVSILKKLSVEELMNIEVTSVSKTPQKLTEVASAIQVITSEDILRSPAMVVPEILRLAPNLQIARSGAHDWSVTARGFNGAPIANSSLADKLLVMIDGRSVYNPLFGGVYWDVQGVLKENIDRIEVVSGPGGTLWGANAVNGVINLITKNAKETQGLSFSSDFGSFLKDGFTFNYGSHFDSTFFFRVSAQRLDFYPSRLANGDRAYDQWNMTRGGFRMDFMPSAKNQFTFQGDLYGGREDVNDSTLVNGQNVLARWSHTFNEKSNFSIQTYYDRTWRNIKPSKLTDEINTFDIDLQYQFSSLWNNHFTIGTGYRILDDNTISVPNTFTPPRRTLDLLSGFIQDQLTLWPRRLELTIGTKVLYNDYTHVEWQPSARLAWTPNPRHTVWSAVSRAVRTPSRFDADFSTFDLVRHPAFKSEKVLSYELGYRYNTEDKWSVSLAIYYNYYDDLRSFDKSGSALASFVFGNNLKAKTWGCEVSGNYIFTNWWRIRGGYTLLQKKFKTNPDLSIANTESLEAIDPNNQAILQSIMNLHKHLELDLFCRYVDQLPEEPFAGRTIPAYFSMDCRIGWAYKMIGLEIKFQNILDRNHVEFGNREIPRSIQGKISFHF